MMVILGISLGSRTTGIAVIKNNELLVARSLTLRNTQTAVHTTTLDNYIRQYEIKITVIKTPPVTHLSDRLKLLLKEIVELFSYHGCMIRYGDAKSMKDYSPELRNKQELIMRIAQFYPGLMPMLEKEQSNKQKYHMKMFEAVSIAHITHAINASDKECP